MMKTFTLSYTVHEIRYIEIQAETKEEARRMFEEGEIDTATSNGQGEIEDTINWIEEEE